MNIPRIRWRLVTQKPAPCEKHLPRAACVPWRQRKRDNYDVLLCNASSVYAAQTSPHDKQSYRTALSRVFHKPRLGRPCLQPTIAGTNHDTATLTAFACACTPSNALICPPQQFNLFCATIDSTSGPGAKPQQQDERSR